MKKIRLWFNK